MKFLMSVDCDNAAFTEGGLPDELGSIIEGVAEKIRHGQNAGNLRDSNGNRVGAFSVEEDTYGD